MSAVDLPLGKLRRRLDARPIQQDLVSSLANSVRDLGIMNPLRVRSISILESGQSVEGWEITAGNHRFEAAKRAGLATAPCVIVTDDDLHAELAMIDENLMRAELSAADRARSTARRKEIFEELHPEARHGSNQHTRSGQVGHSSFAEETAKATGQSDRAVRRDAERGSKISERALSLVAGTHLDSGTYLDKLKKLGPHEQEARVQRELAAGPAPRKPVSPAPDPRNEFESEQIWLAKLVRIFEAAPDDWRERARDRLYPDAPVMDRRHG